MGGLLDLPAQPERAGGCAVRGGDGFGDDVAVLGGSDAEQVGHRGIGAEDVGEAFEGEQFA
jgi:hypothetical protein